MWKPDFPGKRAAGYLSSADKSLLTTQPASPVKTERLRSPSEASDTATTWDLFRYLRLNTRGWFDTSFFYLRREKEEEDTRANLIFCVIINPIELNNIENIRFSEKIEKKRIIRPSYMDLIDTIRFIPPIWMVIHSTQPQGLLGHHVCIIGNPSQR